MSFIVVVQHRLSASSSFSVTNSSILLKTTLKKFPSTRDILKAMLRKRAIHNQIELLPSFIMWLHNLDDCGSRSH